MTSLALMFQAASDFLWGGGHCTNEGEPGKRRPMDKSGR